MAHYQDVHSSSSAELPSSLPTQSPTELSNDQPDPALTVYVQSMPSIDDNPAYSFPSMLNNILCLNPLPPPWIIVSNNPVIMCRMKVNQGRHVEVDFTIRSDDTMKWMVFLREKELNSINCPLLDGLPSHLMDIKSVLLIVNKLNESKLCVGNPDDKFIELHKQRAITLHGTSGKYIRYEAFTN